MELELNARGEKRDALDEPLHIGIGNLETVHAEPRRNLGKLLREFCAHLAQMLQLDVVVLQQARIHHATRAAVRSAIWTTPGLEIDFGAHEQLQRHRLRPELAANLDADDVMVVERARLDQGPHLQRIREDARLEVEDGLSYGAFERRHVHRRCRAPGECGQSVVDHRTADVGEPPQVDRALEASRIEEPGEIAEHGLA